MDYVEEEEDCVQYASVKKKSSFKVVKGIK